MKDNKLVALFGQLWPALTRRTNKIPYAPVIVLGNQKSGTSVIANLIAEYGDLSRIIDIPETWWPALKYLLSGEQDLAEFVKKHKRRFSKGVIKEPNLTFLYPQLKTVLPCAKYLFVIRDPRTNIRSILNRVGLPGNATDKVLKQLTIPHKWKPIFDANLWKLTGRHYIDILAERWNLAVDVYLDNMEDMLLFRYEDFLVDKISSIHEIGQKLNIEHRRSIDSIIDIQYQPIGDQNVSPEIFFGAENLKRIEKRCKDRMHQLQYIINN